MNVFNRLLVILLDVALLVATVAVLLVALGLARPVDLAPVPWFADRLVPFTQIDPVSWSWAVGICLALVFAGLVLLVLELRPGPLEEPRMTLKQDGLGLVTVTRSGVRKVIDRAAGQVAGVTEVRSRLQEGGQGLHVLCRVAVDPTASIPALTQELQERVKAAVEHTVGRSVAEVRVDAQVEPLTGARRAPRRVQ